MHSSNSSDFSTVEVLRYTVAMCACIANDNDKYIGRGVKIGEVDRR